MENKYRDLHELPVTLRVGDLIMQLIASAGYPPLLSSFMTGNR